MTQIYMCMFKLPNRARQYGIAIRKWLAPRSAGSMFPSGQKKQCGKEGTLRVGVTRVFLPRYATPHFREIVVEHTQGQHGTPKHSHKYIYYYYSKRRRAGEPRATISDLTHMLHRPAAFSSSQQHIVTWLERAQQAPSDVT